MENRFVTYNESHRNIIKSGIDSLKYALYNSSEDEIASILFCLDYYLDPYYGCTLSFEKDIYELLQNYLFQCENDDLKMDILELFIYSRYPLTILENNLFRLNGETLSQARYILYDEDVEDFTIVGYYICETSDCSQYLGNISAKMISISNCLCEHQPKLSFCAGWKPNGDNEEYRTKCKLSNEQYLTMSEEISKLFQQGMFMEDGRFVKMSDAMEFYNKYFNSNDYLLVSLAIQNKDISKLDDSFKSAVEINKTNYIDKETRFLGYDIIGWDNSGFHSYLCNSLHKEVENITFTSLGLLDMKYQEVELMAQKFQGKGEPVDWIVCRLDSKLYCENI